MMKWWGWGDVGFTFPMQDKPDLWPWIQKKLMMPHPRVTLPVARQAIKLPAPNVNENFLKEVSSFLKPEQLLSDEDERLLHSYGKSYPDLFRVRQGIVQKSPDLICLPDNHEEVEKLVTAAHQNNVCLIAFGGGTNIVGAVDPLDSSQRMIVSVDTRNMNRVLSVDRYSMTATIQAGALGPKLEADLEKLGLSLGHYPDSFEYSTLGGWLATRSAGMQSDAYGKIEDMAVAIKMATPSGTLVTKAVPASSAGPDLNRLIIGSEGVLGIITEATMRVHRAPAVKDYRGYLFPTFEDGVSAIHECLDRGFIPSMIRLQDSGESELAFNLKSPKKGLEAWIQKPIKKYLKYKGYTQPCIMVVGFEGDEDAIRATRAGALGILKSHKAFSLGKGVGKTWSKDKFNVPYLRDYIMDYACMVDVAETAAAWSKVVPLYNATVGALKRRFNDESNGAGYVGCHISHTYETGACLYFTYAAKQLPGRELEQYYEYKNFVTETFMQTGGTLTHHHAVGYEHLPWMEREVSKTGIQALRAVKNSLDPKGILNPGKLIPEETVPTRTTTAVVPPSAPHPYVSSAPNLESEL